MTQVALARAVQVALNRDVPMDKSMISHWENGNSSPRQQSLPAVAAALGVTVDDLLAGPAPQARRSTAQRNAAKRRAS